MSDDSVRTRRPPPPFRRLAVRTVEALTPRMRRVVLAGTELEGFAFDAPAASVRLLLPRSGRDEIEMPSWTGNQFELADGTRAPIRTFTPRELEPDRLELTLDVVVHDHGAASDWVRSVETGDIVAISGPGRGYLIDPEATSFLLAGDETAIPAIAQLLENVAHGAAVEVHVEISHSEARVELPDHPGADVHWHVSRAGADPGDAFATAVEALEPLADALWIAGEAAAVQRVRRHLFEQRAVTRDRVSAHGYWKHGRSAT